MLHGQFNLGFILASAKGDLFIFDQHACDEKHRFEFLNRTSKIERQPLVAPLKLHLPPSSEITVQTYMRVFAENGFEVGVDMNQPPGGRCFVKAMPTSTGFMFGRQDIEDLIGMLEEEDGMLASQQSAGLPSAVIDAESRQEPQQGLLDIWRHRSCWGSIANVPRPKKVWGLLASRACRSAVMIGKTLVPKEMQNILLRLSLLMQPWNCPHGRPTLRHLVNVRCVNQNVACNGKF